MIKSLIRKDYRVLELYNDSTKDVDNQSNEA